MIIKANQIAELLQSSPEDPDPLVVTPRPDIEELRKSGAASLDLRLGTWFLRLRQSRASEIEFSNGAEEIEESSLTQFHYVPFSGKFILHPRSFVLGGTMEWIRLPRKLAGYVIGRSSWGRRGLIIATATGVHPGFTGCLTLELSNVGEMPIALRPGLAVCQLFLHDSSSSNENIDKSEFIGHRRPTLGRISIDPIAKKLFGGKI
jgi:dCTP deaminase